MCISYDRLLQVTSDIVNGVCQHFRMEDVSFRRAVDCAWYWVKLSVLSCSWTGCHNGSKTVSHSSPLSRFHWMWYCVGVCGQREEDCLEDLEGFSRGDWRIQWPWRYVKWGQWRVNITTRAIRGADVRPSQWQHRCEWRQKTALNTQVQYSGEYSSNPGSTQTAHQARLLPGQLLESGIVIGSKGARPIWLGLDEGDNWVAASLDHSPRSVEIVPWTGPGCKKGCAAGHCSCMKAGLYCAPSVQETVSSVHSLSC